MSKIKVGVIGLGYWGPNLARNIHTSASCELIGLCDTNQTQLDKAHRLYPNAKCVTSVDELLTLNIDAVAIATPVHTHFPLTKQCLKAGKKGSA